MSIGATGGIIFDQAGKELSQTEISDIGTKCIGALDGTHIPVTVSPDERPIYRNRKGDVSTNVLAACGPDLRFIYVLPGWEESVGNSQVKKVTLTSMESSNAEMTGKRKVFGKNKEETRSYFTWTLEMERVLTDVLRDQRNLGNKGDKGSKKSALNVVTLVLSTSFNVNVTSENVKNHIKL
ncbi:hypothetical protein JHK87_010267 [Glycine soja]|nr:hypothetical protein JHK87_010267 [Glycine soja]